MVRTVSLQELRERADELFDDASRVCEPILIEEDGTPRGAVISMAEYERIERQRQETRERGWAAVDRIRALNADKDPDEIYRIVTEVVEEVRQELYDAKRQPVPGDR